MTYYALLYTYVILACQMTFHYILLVIENLAGFSSCSQYFHFRKPILSECPSVPHG